MYLKVPACVFTLFPNKFACIYDNKHASKQIPWIDEFQNEKDIHLSLVNIMPFRYRAALYEGVNGVPLKSVISKILAKKSVISKI